MQCFVSLVRQAWHICFRGNNRKSFLFFHHNDPEPLKRVKLRIFLDACGRHSSFLEDINSCPVFSHARTNRSPIFTNSFKRWSSATAIEFCIGILSLKIFSSMRRVISSWQTLGLQEWGTTIRGSRKPKKRSRLFRAFHWIRKRTFAQIRSSYTSQGLSISLILPIGEIFFWFCRRRGCFCPPNVDSSNTLH